MYVTALSVIIHAPGFHSWKGSCRLLLGRLRVLRTNQHMLVRATSRERLKRLIIVPTCDERYWMDLMPTLAGITHVGIEREYRAAHFFGKVLAQLVTASHQTLRSIALPRDCERARQCLTELLHYNHSTTDFSSIRVLTNAPRLAGTLHAVLTRMPHLVKYTCVPPSLSPNWTSRLPPIKEKAKHHDAHLVSLACYATDLLSLHSRSALSFSCLRHLTDLSIYCAEHDEYVQLEMLMRRPLVRLLRLRLSPCGAFMNEIDIQSFAPNLEQLSLCEHTMWDIDCFHRVSASLMNLSKLTRFQHLELDNYYLSTGYHVTDTDTTCALLEGMMQSTCWRQVTCARTPTAVFVEPDTIWPEQLAQLALIRWHVTVNDKMTTISYRPRVHLSRWRSWFPGVLRACQVVWDRV
jgi:hypothetical protein